MNQNTIVGDTWEFYSYTFGEGMRAFIRFDVSAALEEAHAGFPFGERVIIYLPSESLYSNGTPKQDVFEALSQFEADLIDQLEKAQINCRFVGVMTYSGLREFVFQVDEQKKFDRALKKFLRQSSYKIERRSYPGWSFFDQKVSPKPHFWQQISDRNVIDQLVKAGSDPSKKHTLEHVFIGDGENLKKLLATLTPQGFMKKYLDQERLEVQIDYPLDNPEMIFRMTAYLRDTASKFDLDYDGWGAAVRK